MIAELTPELRERFAHFCSREYGLRFEGARRLALDAGVFDAARTRDVTPRELLEGLLSRRAECGQALIEALTVGETYFFREPDHFKWLKGYLQRQDRPLRLWSAGCATGEEAYSMAIAALEVLGKAPPVRILATDLNPAALERARRGQYRPWSFRGLREEFRQRWFHNEGDLSRVAESVRSLVQFRELNLTSGPDTPEWPRAVNVVFCRNVTPYLDRWALAKLSRGLAAALEPEGFVVCASADPRLTGSSLVLDSCREIHSYRQAGRKSAQEELVRLGGATPNGGRLPQRPATPTPPAMVAARPASSGSEATSTAPPRQLDMGDSAPAPAAQSPTLAELTARLSAEPFNSGLYLKRAQLRLEQRQHQAAVRDSRRALLIDPGCVYAHVLIALSALETRHLSVARRAARTARRLMDDPGCNLQSFADSLTREEILGLLRTVDQVSQSNLFSNPWTSTRTQS